MKPYYEHAGITIYHGDCREILPQVSGDVVITDPPYVGLTGGYKYYNGGVGKRFKDSESIGDLWGASLDWLKLIPQTAVQLIVFTSHHAMRALLEALPGKLMLIGTWHKPNAHPGVPSTPHYSCEFYVGSRLADGCDWTGVKDFISVAQDFGGCVSRGERIRNADGSNAHPTQKPLDVFLRLIVPSASIVIDPFAGTGTTLIAAKDLHHRAIGIEIEERYCEIAAKRLSQEVFQF